MEREMRDYSHHVQHEDPEVFYTDRDAARGHSPPGRSGPPPVNVEEPVGLAGIGVLFERSGTKSLTTIRSIQPLSSADREGTLRPGGGCVGGARGRRCVLAALAARHRRRGA